MKHYLFCFLLCCCSPFLFPQQKPLEFQDIMKFKQIKDVIISNKGTYTAVSEVPDRGNRDLVIYTQSGTRLFVIPRGESAVFSADEQWFACTVGQDFFEKENKTQEKFQPEIWLIRLIQPDTMKFKNAEKIVFSPNADWAFVTRKPGEKKDSAGATKPKTTKDALFEVKDLTVVQTGRKDTANISGVLEFAIDSSSTMLYYSVIDTSSKQGGLYSRNLLRGFSGISAIDTAGMPFISQITANHDAGIAYVRTELENNKCKNGKLFLFDEKRGTRQVTVPLAPGWQIPAKNRLTFSSDGERLFFGTGIIPAEKPKVKTDSTGADNYSPDAIRARREIDVWHWDDPMIKTQEKNLYKKQLEKLYTQFSRVADAKVLQLTDSLVTEAGISNNPRYLLRYTNISYRKEITWDDYYYDASVADLQTGVVLPVVQHIFELPAISPRGAFGVYYKEKLWHLFDCATGAGRVLNDTIATPFYLEDNDLPALPPSYGLAGWLADTAVLINDRYDIWLFSKSGNTALNLTKGTGRATGVTFRIIGTEAGKEFYAPEDTLLLSGYSAIDKSTNIYVLPIMSGELSKVANEQAKISFRAKAKERPVYLYTKERFDLFPDLWIAGANFKSARQLTRLDSQRDAFQWSRAELIHWYSTDGVALDGVLMKPAGWKEGEKFPLIVYFYELFSQRLHEFPDMVVNHRPNFAYYTSHGYGVLLPDVRFEIGEPGQSAIRCVVPGVLKLIEAGLVEPKGVGLIGHSWSGYQAAYMITQTDLFSAAIAGAPVGNMTSAYSGIRNESGMARQFQYEKAQSRIGGSLWEYPERYIANSPVFFADRVNTPLLIEHGDEDEAVPFQQGVELYLAMRRLGKVCYFLQYRGEPHHPKKYPNKVDYAMKQKEFFDAYLKHQPLAPWMAKPTPYSE
jgi:dipeptidyl aminopeptidase/acylaminoacyl peptidase